MKNKYFPKGPYSVYFKYILFSCSVVILLALVQMIYVFKIPLQLKNFTVPLLVGCFFGVILGRNYILRTALAKYATTDSLTGLYNRRWFDRRFLESMENFKRYGMKFSVILLDIDNFKKINDKYGHSIGDEILREVALKINSTCRVTDLCARWGGEEFIILLTNAEISGAVEKAENLRKLISEGEYPNSIHLTCSFGVSEFLKDDQSQLDLVNRADKALYKAKESGRDRVESIIA